MGMGIGMGMGVSADLGMGGRRSLRKGWLGGVSIALVMASVATAHTTVRSQATEGIREDNALRIGHGCGETGAVIAQSVVFPNDAPELTPSDPTAQVADLAEVIVQGSLLGLAQSIQDRSIFEHQTEVEDVNGNVIAFRARRGHLSPNLVGRVPFQFSAPAFVRGSCVKRLLIRIAIADICDTRPPLLDPQKVNLWIPDNGSRLAELGRAAGVEDIGGAATLTVNRNLTSNPLPEACGAGFDLTVTPSAVQVDRDLPMGRFWNPLRERGRGR